jgi:hypothetical protein
MTGRLGGEDHSAFSESRVVFETLVGWLGGDEAIGLDHAELECRLEVAGRELLRQLFQDHLELRAQNETRLEAVVDAEGVPRGTVEAGHQRTLSTIFGEVVVRRLAYRRRGHPNLYPVDGALNLPQERHSHGLRQLAAIEASRGSFDDAVEAIGQATGQQLGKRQVEELARRAALDFDDFYAGQPRPPADDGDVLVLSADGKGIVMRPDSLRPATAAAAKTNPKLKTRLSRGEKRNRKRMAEVGAVYTITPAPRTPADVLASAEEATAAATPAPVAKAKWLTASVIDDAASVVARLFEEAERRDPQHRRTWVALVDGNNHQIDRIKAEANKRKFKITILIDLIHVLEYLWKAAWCFFAEGDPDAEAWVHDKALNILRGEASTVAASIRRKATCLGLSAPARANADTCADYLLRKRPTSTTPPPWPRAGQSPPGSSKVPVATSSKTAWTSPEHAGDSKAPRPSSSYESYAATAISPATGPTTWHKNENESTRPATPAAASREPPDAPSTELHPFCFPWCPPSGYQVHEQASVAPAVMATAVSFELETSG